MATEVKTDPLDARVETECRCGDRVTIGSHSFIPACPPRLFLLKVARRCWSIENVHHEVMGIAFCMEDGRIRTEPAVLNMVSQAHRLQHSQIPDSGVCPLSGIQHHIKLPGTAPEPVQAPAHCPTCRP